MDEILQSSQLLVYALTDVNNAVTSAMEALKKSVTEQKAANNTAFQAQQKALKDQLDSSIKANALQKQSSTDLLSTLTTVSDKIKTALGSTIVQTDDLTRAQRAAAQTVLSGALSFAASGGSLANYAGLEQALTDIARPSESLYASFIDYARDQGRATNTISQLSGYADSQVSVAKSTLDAITGAATAAQANYDQQNGLLTDAFNAENNRLDALLTTAQAQIDAVNGVTTVTMTVEQAITNLATAIDTKTKTQEAALTAQAALSAQQSAKVLADQAAAIASARETTLKAEADVKRNENKIDTSTLAGLISIANTAKTNLLLLQSTFNIDQAAANQAAAAYATASSYAKAATMAVPNIPAFEVGINEVPHDMFAQIHKGERIFPAADNRELMMRLSEPRDSNNADLIAEIKALRSENKAQAQAIVELQLRLVKLMQRWDGQGMPETRTS